MLLNTPIKGIFFDLGWTLIRPESGDWLMTSKAWEIIDRRTLESLPGERLDAADKKAREIFCNEVYMTVEQELARYTGYYSTFAQLLPELGLSPAAAVEMARDRVYNTAKNFVLFDDTVSTLRALRGQYRLGIISDTDPSILRYLKDTGLDEYFDCVTYSFAVGTLKPNDEMYTHAIAAMGLPPEQTVFVDDLPGNLDGAARHGIQGVLSLPRPTDRPDGRYPSIKSPGGLLELLSF